MTKSEEAFDARARQLGFDSGTHVIFIYCSILNWDAVKIKSQVIRDCVSCILCTPLQGMKHILIPSNLVLAELQVAKEFVAFGDQ